MKCANCDAENKENAKFCEKCGTKLEEKINNVCPNCGAAVALNAKFCGKCGTKLINDQSNYQRPSKPGVIYDLEGVRGRHMEVYEDKVIITTRLTVGSFFAGNVTDGEKTIYYIDCVGVQFKKSNLAIGYLQLETASNIMNNRQSNFFNENSFTFDETVVTNQKMEEVANYIKGKINDIKSGKNTKQAFSAADELKKFKELLDMGVITEEEFNKKKKELL